MIDPWRPVAVPRPVPAARSTRSAAPEPVPPAPPDATRPLGVRARPNRSDKRLRVDWPACKAHGLCHELLPEVIGLDEWGFPVVGPDALRGTRLDDAKRAVAACPTLALRLVDIP